MSDAENQISVSAAGGAPTVSVLWTAGMTAQNALELALELDQPHFVIQVRHPVLRQSAWLHGQRDF
jgi:hypothetical protein